ncbi:acyltransferase 3 [Lasiosphaeria hispida]|uniref:Acyltransferase 3 n=1 Tax=Lasiosphaeria hispida TaxID=260671 RepID=A0AAJ0HRS9_9PEZI|nr:acyltransferase 3 [Lasiosphaeria hispida]
MVGWRVLGSSCGTWRGPCGGSCMCGTGIGMWDWDRYAGSTAMDVHLWTIPVEFRSSMMLFLTLVGTARWRTGVRLAVVGVLMVFTYLSDRWEMMLFYAGMALAEMDLMRGAHESPAVSSPSDSPSLGATPPPATQKPKGPRQLIWPAVSLLGLYFMSQPDHGSEVTPGWVFLSTFIPEFWSEKYRYWQSIGAIVFVLAVGRTPAWQKLFSTGPVQYLGKISYAIYLMHGPAMHTLGYAIERRVSLRGLKICFIPESYEFLLYQ